MNKPLPYETIVDAVSGNTEAICAVLKHFTPLINKLSIILLLYPDGAYRLVLDEDIKRELEIELITQITQFNVVNG